MSFVYKARVTLIKFAKAFPFVLCFIVLVSYFESLVSLLSESYSTLDDCLVLSKPVSWFVGEYFVYDWYAIIIAVVLSFAMETCVYNKIAIVYLCINALERDFFLTIALYPEQIHPIVTANILVCGYITWKGVITLFRVHKAPKTT